MRFQYHDGGRANAGYKGDTGDCVVRAVSIATQRPYQEIYELVNEFATKERKARAKKSNARTGVRNTTVRKIMNSLGYDWIPTMAIGSGCQTHLRESELPAGRLVVSLSKHVTAVIDGVIYDTYDPSRNGTRCVYGYFKERE